MTGPIEVDVNADHTVARVAIPLKGNGTDATSLEALQTLRDDVLPATIGKVPGATYAVTGGTAASADENALLKRSAPLVFGFVLTFAFILLLVSFRSIVIAAQGDRPQPAVGRAPPTACSWPSSSGAGARGCSTSSSNGGIAQWLPIFMFVILFGLSMDYHVFILSRIREAYDRGMKTEDAVAHGIKTTAGVVTSAAVVMVGVFVDLRDAPDRRHEGDGRRPRRRRPDRRDDRPGGPAAGDDEAARRVELVPAELARLAAPARSRRRHHGCPGGRRGARTGDVGMTAWLRRLFSRRLERASGGYSPPQPRPSSALLVR